MRKILYIHGFNSGPGNKVADFKRAGFNVICPQLTNSVENDIETLLNIINENKRDELHVVGSSLGGYYALVLSDLLKSKDENIFYHLINPALKPYKTLEIFLNKTLTNYKTNEEFSVTTTFLNALKNQNNFLSNSVEIDFNKRTFYFGMADDVLNNVETIDWIRKHTKIHNWIETQQNHRFQNINTVINRIISLYKKPKKDICVLETGSTETVFIYKDEIYDIITDDDGYPYELIKRGKPENITYKLLENVWANELVEKITKLKS